MKKEEKNQLIDSLAKKLVENPTFYLTDISDLTVEDTNKLRRLCFNKKVSLHVVKNSLLKKAMERTETNYESLYGVLKGSTSIMFCETANTPAKLINEFRKKNKKPILKAAFVESSAYIGDNQLDTLANLKSKNELIGDVIGLLQSPAKNVISALQSGKTKLAGIVKTLSDKKE
jgi:large subunit ribosomal protein L10